MKREHKSSVPNNLIYTEVVRDLEEQVEALTLKVTGLSRENERLEALIERLKTPINVANNDVQERLNLLDALEAGGVDNWEWYWESIEEHKKSHQY